MSKVKPYVVDTPSARKGVPILDGEQAIFYIGDEEVMVDKVDGELRLYAGDRLTILFWGPNVIRVRVESSGGKR